MMTETASRVTAAQLGDPVWRLSNLYKIIIKGEDGRDESEPLVITFKPNRAQKRFIARLWHRNIILKARQMGFTTLIALLWLDYALFTPNSRCGIIAQDKDAAESIFKDKVKFAYDNLPESLRLRFPLKADSATELRFAHNNSSIRVATSMRSRTLHRLHVSEMGKIGAKYPEKAKEVVTGSIPAVPSSGVLVIESTAEGTEGEFYKMTMRAKALHEQGKLLGVKDYRFHFFPWWQEPTYVLPVETIRLTDRDIRYFEELEAQIGRALSEGQKAWYVATREADFSGDPMKMFQEYPGTAEEAFQVSTEGCYYANQLARARKEGRILRIPVADTVPVNTFWDLGRSDYTAIWFHQRVGMENRFIRYYEASGEDLRHYARYLQDTGYLFGKHYVPHDAEYKRLGSDPDNNRSIVEMLEDLLPGQRFEVVPRVTAIQAGIEATRNQFSGCWFDEQGCADGLKRLQNYKQKWNATMGRWAGEPAHDDNSHGADAFRQFAQEADAGNGFRAGYSSMGGGKNRNRGGWKST